jgi:hypothetical protein
MGRPKPIFGRSTSAAGTWRSSTWRSTHLVWPPRSLASRGSLQARSRIFSIEERDPGLEGDRHGCSIELGQDVVGQIAHQVGPEHLLGDPAIGDRGAAIAIVCRVPWSFPSTKDARHPSGW